jgi:hypothetical protein
LIGEWVPFGANQIVNLNDKLGSAERVKVSDLSLSACYFSCDLVLSCLPGWPVHGLGGRVPQRYVARLGSWLCLGLILAPIGMAFDAAPTDGLTRVQILDFDLSRYLK